LPPTLHNFRTFFAHLNEFSSVRFDLPLDWFDSKRANAPAAGATAHRAREIT
jgi:hypothetical protein